MDSIGIGCLSSAEELVTPLPIEVKIAVAIIFKGKTFKSE
jgi:hypothetical protein